MSTLHSTPGSPLIGTRIGGSRRSVFSRMPDDGAPLRLTHGAVTLSLSPVPRHQQPLAEVIRQLSDS